MGSTLSRPPSQASAGPPPAGLALHIAGRIHCRGGAEDRNREDEPRRQPINCQRRRAQRHRPMRPEARAASRDQHHSRRNHGQHRRHADGRHRGQQRQAGRRASRIDSTAPAASTPRPLNKSVRSIGWLTFNTNSWAAGYPKFGRQVNPRTWMVAKIQQVTVAARFFRAANDMTCGVACKTGRRK